MTSPSEPAAAVRILADDLSGALDAAGPFAASSGGLTVCWNVAVAVACDGLSTSLDAGTRALDASAAVARTREAVRALWSGWAGLAFKKVDSVWRGHPAAEIAACAAEGGFERVVLAPAFPQQGRITRDGAQWTADGGAWRCVAPDLPAQLQRCGLDAATEAQASGSTRAIVCEAIAPDDLDAIVTRYARSGMRTLWCGTGGLARALARPAAPGGRVAAVPAMPRPHGFALYVVGTDHPVSVAQSAALARCGGVICRDVDTVTGAVDVHGEQESDPGAVLVRFRVPQRSTREVARCAIAEALRAEVGRLARPGLVVATGGETVRALCEALGATRLEVFAEFEPGLPIARWHDGRWAGTPIVSKSGGFGGQDVFTRLAGAFARRAGDRSSR